MSRALFFAASPLTAAELLKGMGEPDMFVSTEEEVEMDTDTEAAINRGLRDADEGRGVPAEQVRGLLSQWISKLSTETKP
jgi:hypothetical protein